MKMDRDEILALVSFGNATFEEASYLRQALRLGLNQLERVEITDGQPHPPWNVGHFCVPCFRSWLETAEGAYAIEAAADRAQSERDHEL